MQVLLFGGFLGSGKTSVIIQTARFIVRDCGENLVIIENEVGEVGIDDKILTGEGLKVREIFAGCVCCQVTTDLLQAVQEIHEKINPRWLVIEATGLARPGNISALLDKYCRYLTSMRTVVIVDATRWNELRDILENLVIPQVLSADTVLINKIDEVAEKSRQELTGEIRSINAQATVYSVSAQEGLTDEVLRGVLGV